MVRMSFVCICFYLYIKTIKRFCPSAFAYLIAIVPCVWLLELNQNYHSLLLSNQNKNITNNPRRFEFKSSTTAYSVHLDEDVSDSKRNQYDR